MSSYTNFHVQDNQVSSSPSPSQQRGTNTTPVQVKAIIAFFENNKTLFDSYIGRNRDCTPDLTSQTKKPEIISAIFESLKNDQLIPNWTLEQTKSRITRIFDKYSKTLKSSRATNFGLTEADRKKEITTVDAKLEYLCPGFERLAKLHGEQQNTQSYRVSFNSEPSGPQHKYRRLLTSTPSTTSVPTLITSTSTAIQVPPTKTSNEQQHAQVFDDDVTILNGLEKSSVNADLENASRNCNGKSSLPQVTTRTGVIHQENSNESYKEKNRIEKEKLRSKHRLGMLNSAITAFQSKTFGSASWRRVTRNVIEMDKMIEYYQNTGENEDPTSEEETNDSIQD